MLIYNLLELEQQVAEFHLVILLLVISKKQINQKQLRLRDITQETAGLLILSSVINIYF